MNDDTGDVIRCFVEGYCARQTDDVWLFGSRDRLQEATERIVDHIGLEEPCDFWRTFRALRRDGHVGPARRRMYDATTFIQLVGVLSGDETRIPHPFTSPPLRGAVPSPNP